MDNIDILLLYIFPISILTFVIVGKVLNKVQLILKLGHYILYIYAGITFFSIIFFLLKFIFLWFHIKSFTGARAKINIYNLSTISMIVFLISIFATIILVFINKLYKKNKVHVEFMLVVNACTFLLWIASSIISQEYLLWKLKKQVKQNPIEFYIIENDVYKEIPQYERTKYIEMIKEFQRGGHACAPYFWSKIEQHILFSMAHF